MDKMRKAAANLFGGKSDAIFLRLARQEPTLRTTVRGIIAKAAAWETLPKGWTDESVDKFWSSLTGDAKHKITKCIKRMSDHMDDPGAFCGSLADRVQPGWRGKKALAELFLEHHLPRNPTFRQAMSHTIAVKELPEPVRRALREVRYGRRDIEVKPATTYAMAGASGDGSKAFVIAVNLRTGQYKVEYGSWGGSNMFNSRNPVDMDGAKRPIPQDGLIIKGTISSSPTWAYILAHPDNIPKMLPEAGGGEVLGPKEESVLSIIDGIKSGSRQDEFRRAGLGLYGPTNPYVQSLVKKGLVKVLGADGLQITLAGKNYRSQRSKWASELEAAWFEGSV